jgi:transposase-like protein
MGRPTCGQEDYLRWRERIDGQRASGLSVEEYCRTGGFARSSFYRWIRRLREDGVPERSRSLERRGQPKSETCEPVFVPVSVKVLPVEIEFPNRCVIRVSSGISESVLAEIIRAVGGLQPQREGA